MISLAAWAALLRRLFDFNAETAMMEDSLYAVYGGLSLASYGIPVAPVWLPELELRRSTEPAQPR